MTRCVYSFRPLQTEDLPLISRWLDRPHVTEWWDDADGLSEIEQAMREPATEPFIVWCGGQPIGYQQCYDPHAYPDHPFADQPPGTYGIDQFIGEADCIGRGHGSAFIAAFVDLLFARGAPRIVADPDHRNARAIRAYGKAGFEAVERRLTIYGDTLLMARDRAPRIHA
jgi:aminoglycoside 6'-N-acetyltransferase